MRGFPNPTRDPGKRRNPNVSDFKYSIVSEWLLFNFFPRLFHYENVIMKQQYKHKIKIKY